jgi:hypothetical protein
MRARSTAARTRRNEAVRAIIDKRASNSAGVENGMRWNVTAQPGWR